MKSPVHLPSQLGFLVVCAAAGALLWALYLPASVTTYTAHATIAATSTASNSLNADVKPVLPITAHIATTSVRDTTTVAATATPRMVRGTTVPTVPFYSQFTDISDPAWKKIGCGVASLAMVIEYFAPNQISVDTLLQQGIDSGAYLQNAGWTHQGLINLSKRYSLTGTAYDHSGAAMGTAFSELQAALKAGPVIASVYYTFTPGHPIPHLVVINGVKDGVVYYNDPAETIGGGTISVADFKAAWKKRYIEIRPAT